MKRHDPISIAIADDSAFHCGILSLYASTYENIFIIIKAANGYELLNKLSTCDQLPDICIVDLHMPIMNGIITAKIIKKKYPGLHVFGYTSSDDIAEINCYSKFVKKIFNKDYPSALFEEINHIL